MTPVNTDGRPSEHNRQPVRLADGRVRISGTIKDTEEDGKLAVVEIYAYHSGRVITESTGSTKTFTHTLSANATTVTATECLHWREFNDLVVHCGAGESVIWRS